jgi:hypothetical protein
MLLKSVYDLIGAIRILGDNHPFTIVTVEHQHINPPFPSSEACGLIGKALLRFPGRESEILAGKLIHLPLNLFAGHLGFHQSIVSLRMFLKS